MDSFIIGYVLIKLIRILHRAVFYAGSTTRAFVLNNISGFFPKGYIEVPRLAFYSVHLRIGKNLYVCLPVDLDQFRREYSHGAVIGREGLIELSHVSAHGR